MHNPRHKPIRSFVRREGRMTKAQERALNELAEQYIIQLDVMLDFEKIFGRNAPTILEIGFGMGASLIEMAKNAPEKNFIGIEVHRPGVGTCLNAIEQNELTNLRIISHDAVEVLKNHIEDNSLDGIQIYFPDPWPKKRHHKRRIIQVDFVQLLKQKLKPDAILHLATDWENYAEWMMETLSQAEGLENTAGKNNFAPRPNFRPLTKFEKRGKNLGHGAWDLLFKKTC